MINGERSSLFFCLQPVDQLNENDFELNYSETLNCAQQIWKGGLLRTSLLESFSNVLSKCTTIICLSQQKENEMYFEEEEEADSCLLRDECSDDTNLSGKKHVYSVFRKILWENRRVLR